MLYSVGIKNEKGLGVFHYLVRMHLNNDFTFFSTTLNEECNGFEFILYNDEDNSLQSLSREDLIDLIKSGIKINGVSCVQFTVGVKEVSISIVRPPLYNLFKLKSVDKIFERTHKFNEVYLSKAGISDIDTSAHIIVSNTQAYSHVHGLDICVVNDEIVSLPLQMNIREIGNQKVIKLGKTMLLRGIDENNQVSKFNQVLSSAEFTKGYLSSLIDLYLLAVQAPYYVIGCDACKSCEFIVDTLADRYVFEVADGLKQYLLKGKLISMPYFGIEKVDMRNWF